MKRRLSLPLPQDVPMCYEPFNASLLPVIWRLEESRPWLTNFFHQLVYVESMGYFGVQNDFLSLGPGREERLLSFTMDDYKDRIWELLKDGYYIWSTVSLGKEGDIPYLIFGLDEGEGTLSVFASLGQSTYGERRVPLTELERGLVRHEPFVFWGLRPQPISTGFSRDFFKQQLALFMKGTDFTPYFTVDHLPAVYGICAYDHWSCRTIRKIRQRETVGPSDFAAIENHAAFLQYKLAYWQEHGLLPISKALREEANRYAALTAGWTRRVRQRPSGNLDEKEDAFAEEAAQVRELLLQISRRLWQACEEAG